MNWEILLITDGYTIVCVDMVILRAYSSAVRLSDSLSMTL